MFSVSGKLNEEQLKKFARLYSPGEYLFRQGDLGNTMFIIVGGQIELIEERDGNSTMVAMISPGQVLGEKAFLTDIPYRRTFSARAKVQTPTLEFDRKNLKVVETLIPDFATRMLGVAASRLDRSNRIINILRPFDPAERFVQVVLFLRDDVGIKGSEGVEFPIDPSDFYQLGNLDKTTTEFCLNSVLKINILKKTKKGYVIVDENALRQYVSELRERVAA